MPNQRILIIDDEELIRLALSDYLEECGYSTATAADGEIGLFLARSETFDVVLVDLRMPRVDGLEVVSSLSALKPELPIVVISGTGVLKDAVEAIRRGAWDYISKPILDMNEIEVVIERVLERSRLIRERNDYQYQIESFNALLGAEVARQTQDLQSQNRKLNMLNRISRSISHSLELDAMLNRSLNAALEAMQADAGAIRLLSPVTHKLQLAITNGFDDSPNLIDEMLALDDDISASVAFDGSVKFGIPPDSDAWGRYLRLAGYRCYICVPLRAGQDYNVPEQVAGNLNSVLGVLGVFSFQDDAFDVDSVELLMTIGNQIGIAIARAQNAAELREANRQLELANSELRRLDTLREQFIQNVAHELRTPLALVRGYIEMLVTGSLTADETQMALGVAQKRVTALVELVEAITTLQDLDSTPINVQQVNVVELLKTACQMTSQRAQMSGVRLVLDPECHHLPDIQGDFTRLAQAFHQLLDNACKFSPEGVEVMLHSSVTDDHQGVLFSVIDKGVGISEQEFDRIFDRFYQVDGSTKRRYGGTGLGLALVKQIVEAHGGTVSVTSNLGAGSTFTVNLPIS